MWAWGAPWVGFPSPPARPPLACRPWTRSAPSWAQRARAVLEGPVGAPGGLAGYLAEAGVSRNFRIACSTSSFFIKASSFTRRPSRSSVCSSRFSSVFL